MAVILKHSFSLIHTLSGFKVKNMNRKNGRGEWSYAEKGKFSDKYPSYVFLHGIGSSKDHWPSITRKISSKYHVLTVDLPGHGETTFDKEHDHPSIHGYVEALYEFVCLLEYDFLNKPFFLVGISMGGLVALLFTHKYADYVKKLSLLCPAYPTPDAERTDFFKKFLKGDFGILNPTTGEELKRLVKNTSHSRVYHKLIPNFIGNAYVKCHYSEEKRDLFTTILLKMVTEDLPYFEIEYIPKIKEITKDILILWGRNDTILHSSGAKSLEEKLEKAENTQIIYIEKCGHAMQIDQPGEIAEHLKRFLKKNI